VRLDKHKNPITAQFVTRNKITSTAEELIGNVEKQMPAFMRDVYNADHQYLQMQFEVQCHGTQLTSGRPAKRRRDEYVENDGLYLSNRRHDSYG